MAVWMDDVFCVAIVKVKSQGKRCEPSLDDVPKQLVLIEAFRVVAKCIKVGVWVVGQAMRQQDLVLKSVAHLNEPTVNKFRREESVYAEFVIKLIVGLFFENFRVVLARRKAYVHQLIGPRLNAMHMLVSDEASFDERENDRIRLVSNFFRCDAAH